MDHGSGPVAPLRHVCPLLRSPFPSPWSLQRTSLGRPATDLKTWLEFGFCPGNAWEKAPHPPCPVYVRACCLPRADWTTTSWLRLTRCSSKCCVVSVPGRDVSVALVKPVAHCGKALAFNCYLDTQIPNSVVRILCSRSNRPTSWRFSFMLQLLHYLCVMVQFLTLELKV